MSAASLPQPPTDDTVGVANLKTGGLATFEGTVKYSAIHPATLVDMVDVTGPDPFKKNEDGTSPIRPRICWLFTLDEQPLSGKLAFYTSTSLHEKANFPPTCAALGKPAPAKNEPIKKAAFVGAKVGLFLEPNTKNGKTRPKITKLVKAGEE